MKYRFKTSKEFIEEYGPGWRSKVGFNSNFDMDCYIGTRIPDTLIGAAHACWVGGRYFDLGKWTINRQMITTDEVTDKPVTTNINHFKPKFLTI